MPNNASFRFHLNTDLRYGIGVSNQLPNCLAEFGFRKVAVVADQGVCENTTYKDVLSVLREQNLVEFEFVNSFGEPSYENLDEATEQFRDKGLDGIVVFGGGSTIDLAKGISVLLTNAGPAISYRGFNLVRNPGIPLIALPTTAGTGSEIAPNAVFIDWNERRKFGINSSLYLPKLALLDPLLTLTCPKSVTVSSGVDALVHSLEALAAKDCTYIAQMFSREAFKLLVNNLGKVVDEPNDLEARGAMMLGASMAITALFNSGPGPAGAMSYPLGVEFGVPHGIAGGIFINRVIRYNVDHGYDGYAQLQPLLDNSFPTRDANQAGLEICDAIDSLWSQIGVPTSIGSFGVTQDDVKLLTEKTLILKTGLEQNPVNFGSQEVHAMFRQAI